MIALELAAVPNQAFSVLLDEQLYTLTIRETGGVMSADVQRDAEYILRGVRLASGSPIIPYRYLEGGNFYIFTEDDAYPEYSQFGISQSLVYLSQVEIEVIRDQ